VKFLDVTLIYSPHSSNLRGWLLEVKHAPRI
jgi:hypothetical protein